MTKKNSVPVQHIAQLANLPISSEEVAQLSSAFDETMVVVEELSELDTNSVEPTHQVTNLKNVWREDEVDEQRMLGQKWALENAARTHKGYFVVSQILSND